MPSLEIRTKNIFTRRGVGLGLLIYAGCIVLASVVWIVGRSVPAIDGIMQGGWSGVGVGLGGAALFGGLGWWLRRSNT